MERDYRAFTWSDNWHVEGDKAWLVSGMHNILLCLDLKMKECESAVSIPEESSSKFRLTSYCIKCGDNIFCLPDTGKAIWIYNIRENGFSKIILDNPQNVRLAVYDFWMHDHKLFVVSNGLGQIIEIDIINKKVKDTYTLCEGGIRKSIKVGTDIYSLSNAGNEVCQFDLIKKTVTSYILPNIGRKFFTFCYDNEKFWLSGYGKELYVWKKGETTIKTINGFPKEFGVYNFSKETNGETDCVKDEYELPAFLYSVSVGEHVWFIPFQTNKIVYVDKKSYELNVFETEGETETKQSLLGRTVLASKYLLEYIHENRYIGLFSIKNNYILEIDTWEKKTEIKKYTFSNSCMHEIQKMFSGNIFCEGDGLYHEVYRTVLFGQEGEDRHKEISDVGLKIYEEMLKI